MSRSKKYLQRKAIERMPSPVLDAVGKAVLAAVDKAVEDRWDRARRLAAEAEGDSVEERVRSIHRSFKKELSAVGAASGALAAAPVLGTTAAASALVADLGWFAMRATDLVMAIGAAHGHTESTVDERRAWVLSVLAFGEDAAKEFRALVDTVDDGSFTGGERISARLASLAGSDAATLDALRRINTSLASTVVTKYGSRRSILAVGKLLPFGIGAVVGGSANYALIRSVGVQSRRFFEGYQGLLPSGSVPTASAELPPPGTASNGSEQPPPPGPGSRRLPNPLARLSKSERRNAIPTRAAEKG